MIDSRIKKLANILVNYSIKVKPDDWVCILTQDVVALPLVGEIVQHITQAGGHADYYIESEDIQEIILRESHDDQLKWISPVDKMVIEGADAIITIIASSNTRALTGITPKKQQRRQLARNKIFETFMERMATGELRWVATQYPCNAYAQEADMSLQDFEDFVYSATFADQPDPVKCWQNIHDEQQRFVEWLKGKKEIVVRGPNVDITLSIEGRTFLNADGTRNIPSGEIYTSPVEDSVNGWIKFTYPAIWAGREVKGVEFTFEHGKIIDAKAKKNEDFLLSQLDTDAGSRYLGEFAIGTNYGIKRFTKSILYDEKIAGTIHVAIGKGFPEIGGRNESVVHWDFICDMRQDSEILVDGELFYKNGEFQI
ncbi:MAG: aminopeptidase [Anaerolineaceae bacterium 4572_78]|nr:MAG: aminopeptidase [Anaerolineaceae bacterium 4572_78]